MKEIWLAQWNDDNSPQFASSTFDKLLEQIDEWYDYQQVIKGKFERNMEEFDEHRYGLIKYTTNYFGEKETDIVYILNYYYD
jgi:hypothetical protein